MQVGCGVSVKAIKGREYLYFWHYETREGRRRPVHDYIGPARNPESARRAVEALEAYARKAIDDARRWLQSERVQALASSR